MPCTIINTGLAIIIGVVVSVISDSMILGGVTVISGIGLVHQRGYLVPYTPQLTQHYLPDQVLDKFGKESISATSDRKEIHIDPERVLVNAGVVAPCKNGGELCLTQDFQIEWEARLSDYEGWENASFKKELEEIIRDSPEEIEFIEFGGGFVANHEDGTVGQWPSEAAVIADTTATELLSEESTEWSDLNSYERLRVLAGLRIFLEQCPECGGVVQPKDTVVSSCCRSNDVLISSCQNCGARLLEYEWPDEMKE